MGVGPLGRRHVRSAQSPPHPFGQQRDLDWLFPAAWSNQPVRPVPILPPGNGYNRSPIHALDILNFGGWPITLHEPADIVSELDSH
jgi:hypothetical protein